MELRILHKMIDLAILEKNYFREYSPKVRIGKTIMSLLILCMGGFIYICFRDKSLLMFDWFNHLGLTQHIDAFRSIFNSEGVYGWIKYSLPDGLWLFAYMFLIDAIWNGSKSICSFFFTYNLPILALVSELLQYFGFIPGVFDWIDVASYLIAILLYISLKILKLL